MRHLPTALLLLALCDFARADEDAFVPPEAPTGDQNITGFEVHFEGRRPNTLSVAVMDANRRLCEEVLGRPYVSTVRVEDLGKARRVVVQGDGISYHWHETEDPWAGEPFDTCRMGMRTTRTLSIARFDGRRTHTTRYHYNSRRSNTYVQDGDKTFFGANAVQDKPGKAASPQGSIRQRTVAGLPCTERRVLPSEPPDWAAHTTECVTGPLPFPGRDAPLSLATRIGGPLESPGQYQATVVKPRVRVDTAVFKGPPGFQAAPRRGGASGDDEPAPQGASRRSREGGKP